MRSQKKQGSVLVIGGSRFIGPRIIDRLLASGFSVTVFNRGMVTDVYPSGVLFVRGDRRKGFPFKEKFDAVIDMCAYGREDSKRALHDLRFNFFIHMGTAAAYRKPNVFPVGENSPLGDWPLWGAYNRGKVECEKIFEESGISFAVVRPVYVLGAGSGLNREHFIYQKVKNKEPLTLPGDGKALVQYVFVEEVAETVLRILDRKITGPVNCAGNDSITLIGLVEQMASFVGRKPIIRFNPAADGANHNQEEFPFANEHLLVTNERARGFGVRFMSLREGLQRDYEGYYKGVI